MWASVAVLVGAALAAECYVVNPGPRYKSTNGEAWPKPQQQNSSEQYYVVLARRFEIKTSPESGTCQTLEDGLLRYRNIINAQFSLLKPGFRHFTAAKFNRSFLRDANAVGNLDTLYVTLNGSCDDTEYPTVDTDERYSLAVSELVSLESNTVWGVLRGLETFSQLIYLGDDGISLRLNLTTIVDFPRFHHRGFMLDTSRHYISLSNIYKNLDAMEYNKLNVFHWHIVDDESFPYMSKKYPELSEQGAYNPITHVYSQTDIQNVIEYARNRGIRVVPEFDTPGHTRSWGVSHPELLTPCGTAGGVQQYGPVDPSKDELYNFTEGLFGEVAEVFKDPYIHLGGDEVDFDCWQASANITEFMKQMNISGDYVALEGIYIQRLIDVVNGLGSKSVVWQEVFTNGVIIPNDTIVHVWKPSYESVLAEVTAAGQQAILSSCWYLDHLENGGDWQKYYTCEPLDFVGTDDQKKLVIGGEACMWTEVVNDNNVITRVWPRAAAVAERLWSDQSVTNINDAISRLEEQACRMSRRGVAVQPPSGPGFCP